MTDNTTPTTSVPGVTVNPETIQAPEDTSIYAELVREYVQLDYELEPIKARMEEIKKVLRDLPNGTHDIAGAKVTIARNARFDAKKFAELYPQEEHPHLWKSGPDNTEIKRTLPPAVVEAMQTEGEPRVSIK